MVNVPGRKVAWVVIPILNGSLEKENVQHIIPLLFFKSILLYICLFISFPFPFFQGVDIQLGMAIDSTKATLAVKRRLACEMVKCWQQVMITWVLWDLYLIV